MANKFGSLSITVHEANLLKDVETFGKQDPYCKIKLDTYPGDKPYQRSNVHQNGGKNPKWGHTFHLPTLKGNERQVIFNIWDYNQLIHKKIAFGDWDLKKICEQETNPSWWPVMDASNKSKPCGDVLISVNFVDKLAEEKKAEEAKKAAEEQARAEEEAKKAAEEAAQRAEEQRKAEEAEKAAQEALAAAKAEEMEQLRKQQEEAAALLAAAKAAQEEAARVKAEMEAAQKKAQEEVERLKKEREEAERQRAEAEKAAEEAKRAAETAHGGFPSFFAFKTYTGKFVGVGDDGRPQFFDEEDKTTTWEAEKTIHDRVAFRNKQTGKYMCDDNGTLVVDRGAVNEWERFEVRFCNNEKTTFCVKTHREKWVCFENDTLVPNRDAPGGWESFDIKEV